MIASRKRKQTELANRSRMRMQTWLAKVERGGAFDTDEDFLDSK